MTQPHQPTRITLSEHDSARGVTAPHHGGHRNPTSYGRGTGRRLKIIAIVFAIALVVAYVAVNRIRQGSEDQLAQATERQSSLPPAVVVVTAEKAAPTVSLTLPGSTAAWYESTIYARVNGYVGKWYVDIGDRVKKGQVLAEIETPDLDAQLAGAGATLKSAEAEVHVKQAQAEFAKTTYERWRDSPKGVVSDQERDAKKADYDGAVAQLNAADGQRQHRSGRGRPVDRARPNSNRSPPPLTAASSSATSTSATWSPPAAPATPVPSTACRRTIRCACSSTCRRTLPAT